MKKSYINKKITEIIDDENILIGADDEAKYDNNKYSKTNVKTSDDAVKQGHQNFKNGFLGRFGFYFYESDEKNELHKELTELMYDKFKTTLEYYHDNPNKLNSDYEKHFKSEKNYMNDTDRKWADKVIKIIDDNDNEINENIVSDGEDKEIVKGKVPSETLISKESKNKIRGLLSKLDKNQIDGLIEMLKEFK